jgi:hypothetical protein
MKLSVSDAYRARAEHCLQQSQLSNDAQLKKYWDDLAAEWLVLENSDLKSESPGVGKYHAS